MSGIVVTSLYGNCPVQAEGTFDGVPFYFRARGTQVTCDVGEHTKEPVETFEWRGPEYEWPDAGWISEAVARGFIAEAYAAWQRREKTKGQSARYRRLNGHGEAQISAIWFAAQLERDLGDAARPAIEWLMSFAKAQHPEKDV